MSLIYIVHSYKYTLLGRTKENVKGINFLKQTVHVKYTKMRRDQVAERSEGMDKEPLYRTAQTEIDHGFT